MTFPEEVGGLHLYAPGGDGRDPADGWAVASGWGWLPGLYDTREAAISADGYDTDVLQEISDRICSRDRENRLITMDDLAATRTRQGA